jgi:hypothetical protein
MDGSKGAGVLLLWLSCLLTCSAPRCCCSHRVPSNTSVISVTNGPGVTSFTSNVLKVLLC